MGDYILNVRVDGREADGQLEKVVREMNSIQEKAKKTAEIEAKMVSARRELASYARKEREEAFNKLSLDERLNRLMERREQIQRRIANATSEERRTLLKVADARNDAQIKQLQSGGLGETLKDDVLSRVFIGLPGGSFLQRMVGKIGASKLIGGLAGAGMVAAVGSAIKDAGAVSDLADRVDMPVSNLQRLGFAANATGAPVEGFVHTIENIQKAQSEALNGNESFIKDFKNLHYSLEELKNLHAEDIFYKLTQGIKDGTIPASNYASLLSVMGRESKDLMAAFKNGPKDAAQIYEDRDIGVSSGTTRALDEAGDWFTKQWAIVKGKANKYKSEFAGGVVGISKLAGAAVLNIPAMFGSESAAQLRDDLLTSRELQFDKQYNKGLDLEQTNSATLKEKQAQRDRKNEEAKLKAEKDNADAAKKASEALKNGGQNDFKLMLNNRERLGLGLSVNHSMQREISQIFNRQDAAIAKQTAAVQELTKEVKSINTTIKKGIAP